MAEKLNEEIVPVKFRSNEELEEAIESVKLKFGKCVELTGVAPKLAENLFAIHGFLVELKWMRGKIEQMRLAKERGNE